jgi:hypothetical protein
MAAIKGVPENTLVVAGSVGTLRAGTAVKMSTPVNSTMVVK